MIPPVNHQSFISREHPMSTDNPTDGTNSSPATYADLFNTAHNLDAVVSQDQATLTADQAQDATAHTAYVAAATGVGPLVYPQPDGTFLIVTVDASGTVSTQNGMAGSTPLPSAPSVPTPDTPTPDASATSG